MSAPGQRAEPSLPRLVGLGLMAAALFSSTFVLNRAMSLDGGHWVWSAALRYVDMALLLSGWILLRGGPKRLGAVLGVFRQRLGFWIATGSVGFGVFYIGICYAADHAPGWIVAATWQSTILATPLVLLAFRTPASTRANVFLVVIFVGILFVNASRFAAGVPLQQVLHAVVPVLLAAIAYPIGNQLLSRARHAQGTEAEVLADPASSVLILTLGSLPLFAGVILLTAPPPPGTGQLINTFAVAVLSGVLATTIFLYARNSSSDPVRIAAVDATQAGEVVFALAAEMLFLAAPAPDLFGWLGLAAVAGGLLGCAFGASPTRPPPSDVR